MDQLGQGHGCLGFHLDVHIQKLRLLCRLAPPQTVRLILRDGTINDYNIYSAPVAGLHFALTEKLICSLYGCHVFHHCLRETKPPRLLLAKVHWHPEANFYNFYIGRLRVPLSNVRPMRTSATSYM